MRLQTKFTRALEGATNYARCIGLIRTLSPQLEALETVLETALPSYEKELKKLPAPANWAAAFADATTQRGVITAAPNALAVLRAQVLLCRDLRWMIQYARDGKSDKAVATAIASGYGASRGDLVTRLGQFCSYCESPVAANLAVEHLLPKASFPLRCLSWDNFLLACSVCNEVKGEKPSYAEGRIAATTLTTPTPTDDQIQTAADLLALWPTDATNYPNFGTVFRLALRKIYYPTRRSPPKRVSKRAPKYATEIKQDVPADDLNEWILNSRISSSPQRVVPTARSPAQSPLDSLAAPWPADRVYARLKKPLFNFPLSTPIATPAEDPVANLPSVLKQAFAAIRSTAPAHSFDPTDANARARIEAVGAGWRLFVFRKFTIDTTSQNAAPVVNVWNANSGAAGTLTTTAVELGFGPPKAKDVLAPLNAGVLPDNLAGPLGANIFVADVTVKREQGSRSRYIVTVLQKFDIDLLSPGAYRLSSLEEFPAEVRIVALSPLMTDATTQARLARAAYDIDTLRLNNPGVNALNLGDNRVFNRTRTFLTAVESVRRTYEVALLNNSAALVSMLLAVKATMIGTGMWTVWACVVLLLPTANGSGGQPFKTVRDALLALLADQASFPGTR